MNNKVLIIAGMHRSGTSLISNWLHHCGLNLGEQLLGPDIGNAEGHFEDIDFFHFHEDTLRANELPQSGLTTKRVPALSNYQHEKLKSLVALKNKLNVQWGWKDPRTCLFLDYYRSVIPDACYLNIVRDYGSTVNSLISREFKHHERKYLARKWLSRMVWKNLRREKNLARLYYNSAEAYLEVWIKYNEELLKNTRHLPANKYIFVDYLSLLDNDKNIFNCLKNQWKLQLKYYDFKRIFKEGMLSERANIDEYIENKALLKKAADLENELKNLCQTQPLLQTVLQ